MKEKIEVLNSVYEYIKPLYSGIGNIVLDIREQQYDNVDMLMIQIIDGLRWVVDALYLTKDIHLQEIEIEDIKEHLRELVDAMEQNDKVSLADIFEFEVMNVLEEWYGKIEYTLKNFDSTIGVN